jgi:hypothetical protein
MRHFCALNNSILNYPKNAHTHTHTHTHTHLVADSRALSFGCFKKVFHFINLSTSVVTLLVVLNFRMSTQQDLERKRDLLSGHLK